MLYKDIAPISNYAWEEIDDRAKEVLKLYLSARKFVNVTGPMGLDYNAISEGRLADIQEDNGVRFGSYKVVPLTESRIEFEMNRWELDNVNRGAKDVDFGPLEDAMEKLALFEEKSIFTKIDQAIEEGLNEGTSHRPLPFGSDLKEVMASITEGVMKLRESYVEGSYTLVVSPEAYKIILAGESTYPVTQQIEALIEGKILLSHAAEGAYLVPYNHEDLELTIGRDFSIGYQSHTNETVKLFAKESFAFRVLDEGLIVKYTI